MKKKLLGLVLAIAVFSPLTSSIAADNNLDCRHNKPDPNCVIIGCYMMCP